MKAREIDCYKTFCRARAYMDAHPELFGDINSSGMRQEFDRLVDLLGMYVMEQETLVSTTLSAESRVEALRRELFDCHIVPIITFAEALKPTKLPHLKVSMPSPKLDTTALALAGGSLIGIIEPYKATFIEMGLEPDFLERLRDASVALSEAVVNHGMKRGRQEGTIVGSGEAVTRASAHLRAIGALVIKRIRMRPELLTEWRAARRLPSHGRKAGSVDDAVPQLGRGKPIQAIATVAKPKALMAGSEVIVIEETPSDTPDQGGEQRGGLIAGVRRLLSGV